jgi:hypothetical protein
MAWRPGDALIEFGGRFALGLRGDLALAMNILYPVAATPRACLRSSQVCDRLGSM